MPRRTYEFSIGPTGSFYRMSRSFVPAQRVARETGQRLHLYAIENMCRIFLGYMNPDGTVTDQYGGRP